MNAHDAKEYLKRAYQAAKRENEIRERIVVAEEQAKSATGSVTAERVSGTPGRSKVETYALLAVGYKEQLDDIMCDVVKFKTETSAAISMMQDERSKRLLELRYIDFLPWHVISRKMNYSEAMVRQVIHYKAIGEFAELMTEIEEKAAE